MSYDINIKCTQEGHVHPHHHLTGGTYALDGTNELWLNVTYNYSSFFRKAFGDEGIRWLYGKTPRETEAKLVEAIERMDDTIDEDYWKATEGNARAALENLVALGRMCPDGVWEGD